MEPIAAPMLPGINEQLSKLIIDTDAPPRSALSSARMIEDLNNITYPDDTKGPQPVLNVNAEKGKFFYDRDFLLQFMEICTDKPPSLPALGPLGIEKDPNAGIPLDGHLKYRSGATGSVTPRSPTGDRSLPMGGLRVNTSIDVAALFGGMITSSPKRGASHHTPRTRSLRGRRYLDKPSYAGSSGDNSPSSLETAPRLKPVVRHGRTVDDWYPADASPTPDTADSIIVAVERRIKALLDKLTTENFDNISDKVIQWANMSKKENDGRTLALVIHLILEAMDQGTRRYELFARLCSEIMEKISPDVQDDDVKDTDGRPIAGRQLVHRYLINQCQYEFERAGALLEEATGAGNAKRRILDLVEFFCELFRLHIMKPYVIHVCIRKLLTDLDPKEEDIECAYRLFSTIGQLLETTKARAHMDKYFSRMKEMSENPNISSRIRSTLEDIIELRSHSWVPSADVTKRRQSYRRQHMPDVILSPDGSGRTLTDSIWAPKLSAKAGDL